MTDKLAQLSPTIEAAAITPSADPREQLIPRAPDVDGGLPSGPGNDGGPPLDGSLSGGGFPGGDIAGGVTMPDFSFGLGGWWSDFWGSLFGDGGIGAWSLLGLLGGIGALLAALWSVYTFLAYLLSLLFILLYIYATMRLAHYGGLIAAGLRDEEARWNELYGNKATAPSQLDGILANAASDNPNDWKIAIIEADILLDNTLTERGYAGETLGEMLRGITPAQIPSIQDAWEAHVVRNKIAHQGSDFVLTKRLVKDTITRYQRVFADLGVQ